MKLRRAGIGRNHTPRARRCVALPAVFAVAILIGCGGGGHEPEGEVAGAAEREESAKGQLLLAEVEYEQAFFREAPEEFEGKPAKIARIRRESVAEAHHLQAECHEGNGLEECDSLGAIEAVVEELDQESSSG